MTQDAMISLDTRLYKRIQYVPYDVRVQDAMILYDLGGFWCDVAEYYMIRTSN